MPASDIHVVLLSEAGKAQGYGHLSRCCALYDSLADAGCSCELLVAGELPAHVVEGRRARIAEWREPGAVATLLSGAHAAVIDSYSADEATLDAIRREVDAALFVDDHSRIAYPPGLVLNSSPAADILQYPMDADEHEYLLGPRYHPLRHPFWHAGVRMNAPVLRRVLVVFGGTDVTGASMSVAEVVQRTLPGVVLDVVRTPRTAHEMCVAMLEADAAVSAAGQTLYELARCGTPTVAVVVAENQVDQARAWHAAGAIQLADVGEQSLEDAVAAALTRVLDEEVRARMARAGQSMVDGDGGMRVARELMGSALDARMMYARAAAHEVYDVLALSNDPVVREHSLSQEEIGLERHKEWFEQLLADPARRLYLAHDAGILAGQVRFDVRGREARVSVSIAKEYRGLGWARHLLERTIAMAANDMPGIEQLVAEVKPTNPASASLFERLGFERDPAAEAPIWTYVRPVAPNRASRVL